MRYPIKITESFLLAPVLHTFGVREDNSYVDLAETTFEVKMGVWFHEAFPVAAVKEVGPSDWPWWGGLGVKLHHHGVGVVGATDGIVNVKFRAPQKATAVVTVQCEQLWLSLGDPAAFLDALAKAAGVSVSGHLPF